MPAKTRQKLTTVNSAAMQDTSLMMLTQAQMESSSQKLFFRSNDNDQIRLGTFSTVEDIASQNEIPRLRADSGGVVHF